MLFIIKTIGIIMNKVVLFHLEFESAKYNLEIHIGWFVS